MNICLLTMEWPPNGFGIGTYMFNLARGLSDHGHNVTVITHNKIAAECPGVGLIQVPMTNNKRTIRRRIQRWRTEPYHSWALSAYKRFLTLCDSRRFDIIETAEFGAWGRHFVAKHHPPVVVRCHCPHRVQWEANKRNTDGTLNLPLWLKLLDRYECRQTFLADGIVSPGYALACHLSLIWGIRRGRFAVLPNPIDSQLFCPQKTADSRNREILYVGRFEDNKGVFNLAKAVTPLMKKYHDISIRFVGMDSKSPEKFNQLGPTASQVIGKLIPSQYHNRISFISHTNLSEIVSYWQKALCTVIPTRSFESFSYTVIEAMACGCPVIATHCGGPTEIITDHIDGLLVQPDDIDELTDTLEKLVNDSKLCQTLTTNARKTVEQRFSTNVVIPKIVNFYNSVITEHRKKVRDGF